MMQRIHIANPTTAEKVQKRLTKLTSCHCYMLKSGCKYENGRILETDETGISFAVGLLESLREKFSYEY